jgi:hypothetical protein
MGLAVASGPRTGGEGEKCRHVVAERNGFRVDSFSLFLVFYYGDLLSRLV